MLWSDITMWGAWTTWGDITEAAPETGRARAATVGAPTTGAVTAPRATTKGASV